MDATEGQMPLTDQEKLDQLIQAAGSRTGSIPDRSGEADDFHQTELPRSHWPVGLTTVGPAVGGHLAKNLDKLTQVPTQLAADVANLRGALSRFKRNGRGGGTIGGWSPADSIGINAVNGHNGVSILCQRVIDDGDEKIDHLRQIVANYVDVETSNATAANNMRTGVVPASWMPTNARWGRTRFAGGSDGRGAITGSSYEVKTEPVAPASASGRAAREIETLFSRLDPSAVAEAGWAHTTIAEDLRSYANSLVRHAEVLASAWSGAAAEAAITAFRQHYEATMQVARDSAQIGQVLTWLGETILPCYKDWKASDGVIAGQVESLIGSNPQDQDAQRVMERLNDRLSQANVQLPSSISFGPPNFGEPGHTTPSSIGSNPRGGVGRAIVSSRFTGSVGGTTSPADSGWVGLTGMSGRNPGPGGSFGVVPTTPDGHTLPPTHLAGFSPSYTPPSVGSVPGGPGGLPGGGLPGGGLPGGTASGGALHSGHGSLGPAPVTDQDPGQGPGGAPGEGMPSGKVGAFPRNLGGYGAPGTGIDGNIPLGPGLVGEGGGFWSDESPVVGSDGMIGLQPGITHGGFSSGNAGATGFMGADDSATQPGCGLPLAGGSGSQRCENERHRQTGMAEDIDTWEGPRE